MKKYLKMPRAVRLATLFAMIPALFLGGCGQQTKCEKSIDTAMGTVISQTVYVTENSPTATDGKTDEKVTDVVNVGDQIKVKLIEVDRMGRYNFSRRDALPKQNAEEE